MVLQYMLYTCMCIYKYMCVCVCVISYHIISYHITSHHIISHHIISLSLSLILNHLLFYLILLFQRVPVMFQQISQPPRGSPAVPSAARSAHRPQRPAAWVLPSSWRTSGAVAPRSPGPSPLWKVLELERLGLLGWMSHENGMKMGSY